MPHETKMTNMKMSAKEAKGMIEGPATANDTPKYPYGLRITLNDEAMKKLGMKEIPSVGSSKKIYAKADVVESSVMETAENGKSMRMELQITDLAFMDEAEGESPEEKLYK